MVQVDDPDGPTIEDDEDDDESDSGTPASDDEEDLQSPDLNANELPVH